MRRIAPWSVWIGHRGDLHEPRRVLAAGIEAVIDLALEEPPVPLTRELVYCRFPLIDGTDNPPWLLRAAVETGAGFIQAGIPTLVCCGAGMSRSPAVAAAALTSVFGRPLDGSLGRGAGRRRRRVAGAVAGDREADGRSAA